MTATDPILKSRTVPASPEKAFEVFTAGMSRWWNPEYSIGTAPLAEIVVEPSAGGRWYERGTDGSQCQWGRVLVWEPPHRLVLDWQISAAWAYDPALHTELEVRFTALDAASTHVELEHRGLDAFGADAEQMRGVFDAADGWAGLLERLSATLA